MSDGRLFASSLLADVARLHIAQHDVQKDTCDTNDLQIP